MLAPTTRNPVTQEPAFAISPNFRARGLATTAFSNAKCDFPIRVGSFSILVGSVPITCAPYKFNGAHHKGTAMNGLVNPLHVSRFLQIYDEAAVQKGIKLSIGFDFYEYVSITRTTPNKEPTTVCFRPPIKSGDGFWMIGVDKNSDVAVLQAVRLYELSHSNVAEHLIKMFCPVADPHGHPQDRCTCTSPSAKKIAGKVAYHGDGWVRKNYRGQGIPKIMAGVAFGVSFAMWNPDFICALVGR